MKASGPFLCGGESERYNLEPAGDQRAVAAMGTLLPIAAHQLGLLKHLPDLPSWLFASDRITDLATAHPLGVPDGLLGLGNYVLTPTMALQAQKDERAKKLLALKLLAHGSFAEFNVVNQVVSFQSVCSWCAANAVCTAAMVSAGHGPVREEGSKLRPTN